VSLVDTLGDHARAATTADAARFGDVIGLAIPMGRYREVPTDAVADKVVIDADNYYPSETATSQSSTATAPPRASCCELTS
jgi:predicted dinucleotide-binding enzyme